MCFLEKLFFFIRNFSSYDQLFCSKENLRKNDEVWWSVSLKFVVYDIWSIFLFICHHSLSLLYFEVDLDIRGDWPQLIPG